MNYTDFLDNKRFKTDNYGFDIDINDINPKLFDFQKAVVKWAIKKGKSAIFADCGLGKTAMQLEWAYQIHKKEQKPILILAPLAVSKQTVNEGKKFDIEVNIVSDQSQVINGINITNYEKLHKFNAHDFVAVILDESSILKSFTGKMRNKIIEGFSQIPYKLACTATPSPNDFMELGNHCEFLNVMSRTEMLSMFFINDASDTKTWKLKGHAEDDFWQFIGSWAVMFSSPKDIGFDDTNFVLPKLKIHKILLKTQSSQNERLFDIPVEGLNEIRKARKASLTQRIEKTYDIINANNDQFLIW